MHAMTGGQEAKCEEAEDMGQAEKNGLGLYTSAVLFAFLCMPWGWDQVRCAFSFATHLDSDHHLRQPRASVLGEGHPNGDSQPCPVFSVSTRIPKMFHVSQTGFNFHKTLPPSSRCALHVPVLAGVRSGLPRPPRANRFAYKAQI